MKLQAINVELRGIEKREVEDGVIFKFNFEDENGNPFELYTKDEKLIENKQKGKKYNLDLDYNFKFKSMKLQKINEVK